MEITVTGWLLIPIALWYFGRSMNMLFYLTIFFIPFSATAVFNLSFGFGFQAYQLFGLLLIVRGFLRLFNRDSAGIERSIALPAALLIIFGLTAAMSLVMPLLIDGRLAIVGEDEITAVPHLFSLRNISQLMYLFFGISISIATTVMGADWAVLTRGVRIYVLSGIFVSAWGWLQLILYRADIPYPSFLFNNSSSHAAQNYATVLDDLLIKRVSSVATEPSVMAQVLLTIVPFVFFPILVGPPLFSRVIDRVALVMMMITLLLSTSTTGYVGLVLLLLLFLVVLNQLKYLKTHYLVVGLLSVLIAICAYCFVPVVSSYVDIYLVRKMSSGSGIERVGLFLKAVQYFFDYPILGIGWGSVGSSDLMFAILANAGVVAFVPFMFAIVYVLAKLLPRFAKSMNRDKDNILDGMRFTMAGSITMSLVMVLIVNGFTGFAYVFGHFWFILGLAMVMSRASEADVSCGDRAVAAGAGGADGVLS